MSKIVEREKGVLERRVLHKSVAKGGWVGHVADT